MRQILHGARSGFWLTALALSVGLAMPGPVIAQGVITLEHAVKNCRLIPDKTTRLNCYDSVIDEAAASTAKRSSEAVPAPVRAAPRSDAPAAPAYQPPPTQETAAAPATGAEKKGFLKRIFGGGESNDAVVTIADARTDGSTLRVAAKDGTVWEQTDSTDIHLMPKPGSKMSISPGAFGKSFCQVDHSNVFDCKRIQ